MDVLIGCSGFYYKDWKEAFYPGDLPSDKWLEYYASKYNSVEINNSFYKIPEKKDLRTWAENTPDDFRFVFKGSRYITHMKKLKEDQKLLDALDDFYGRLEPILSKTAGILWQFPANFPMDPDRIESFANHLNRDIPNFLEFRKPEWFSQKILRKMNELELGFVTVSAPGLQFQEVFPSGGRIYLRLHGKYKWYDYDYDMDELKEYQEQIEQADPGQVFIFFNNDVNAQAPLNARQMKQLFN